MQILGPSAHVHGLVPLQNFVSSDLSVGFLFPKRDLLVCKLETGPEGISLHVFLNGPTKDSVLEDWDEVIPLLAEGEVVGGVKLFKHPREADDLLL